MKITVVHGGMRHGSTWHCMDLIRQGIEQYEKAEITEFFLPRDMPHFCAGCYSCFTRGEDACPHASSVAPIIEALAGADLIVLTSPVYGLDVSGQMKAFIDHLCFMWLSHRPNPAMFHKIGLVVTTTAGAGLSHTAKTMRNSLVFWGVKKVFSYKKAVSAMNWSDISGEKQEKIKKDAAKLAAKIYTSVRGVRRLPNPFFRSFLFRLMAGMQKKNDWNLTDRNHWEKNGWLAGKRPF